MLGQVNPSQMLARPSEVAKSTRRSPFSPGSPSRHCHFLTKPCIICSASSSHFPLPLHSFQFPFPRFSSTSPEPSWSFPFSLFLPFPPHHFFHFLLSTFVLSLILAHEVKPFPVISVLELIFLTLSHLLLSLLLLVFKLETTHLLNPRRFSQTFFVF